MLQPAAPAEGVDDEVVKRYPATPILSVAVNVNMETVNVVEVAGSEKDVTVGGVVSGPAGSVIATAALLLVDTFPAPSFAQA